MQPRYDTYHDTLMHSYGIRDKQEIQNEQRISSYLAWMDGWMDG